jgi:hypothetical protein
MRPGKMAILVVCVLAGGLVASPGVAWAAASGQAAGRKHARKANHLADINKCKQAIPEFSKAIRLLKDPALLFNRAECYRRIGESAKAVTDYRKFLVQLPSTPNRSQVEGQIAVLEKPTGPRSPGGRLAASRGVPEPPSLPAALPPTAVVDGQQPSRPGETVTSGSPSGSAETEVALPAATSAPAPPTMSSPAPLAASAPARSPSSSSSPAPAPSPPSAAALAFAPTTVAEPVSAASEAPADMLRASPAADSTGSAVPASSLWWLWVLGAVVVAGGAAGVYFALGQGKTDVPMSPLGNYKF